MEGKNSARRLLIEVLTKTHQDSSRAYKEAIEKSNSIEEKETIMRIAKALKVKL